MSIPESLGEREARELLRRFEPVLRMTAGDRFFPTDAEPYVRSCSLWVQPPGREALRVAVQGELSLENLARQPLDEPGAVHFLRFTDPEDLVRIGSRESLDQLGKRAARSLEQTGRTFKTGRGRLARVGYFSRFVDALYSVALLARGRVPGEAAAAATLAYARMLQEREHYAYHGRAVRQGSWTVLQYWLFYPFNDWRSGFFGANDHEADWEKVMVYLAEDAGGELRPEWVAYAAHNYTGDDLRRRWDDEEVEKVGSHPVVYVCAGSHASMYAPGEYLTELSLPLPRPLARAARAVRRFWRKTLGQYGTDGSGGYLSVPFVDYARGDGLSIGPGAEREWDPPRLMQEPLPDWVSGYRGLWGLYARDPFEGEDAPAGPMYERDKTVSRAWYDPVGWAGLDKVPTSVEAARRTRERRAEIEAGCVALRERIAAKSALLERLGAEAAATRDLSHLDAASARLTERVRTLSEEINALRDRLATDETVVRELERSAERLEAGEREPARAHIARAHRPASPEELGESRAAEAWAAISVGLMLIGFAGIFVFERERLLGALVLGVALFAFFEAGFRGQLTSLIGAVNVGLAAAATLVLLYEFLPQLAVVAVLLVGLYVLWDNLRELVRG
ncbi:Hypothetical Protein RradSPS_3045 (plasmid) [Rubrobacter radiotolerans]|uniref:Uncharacterized protein n=1 Tax=Rubrobacter radiotolerans TaxID=42256 RepID=A0A023X7L4_RUBRA|nr:hypothetical protein [Rubrobacter radiotolerans]AHY48328.1 Hypothetical Protein RradSPS_3045 [Rubrobacter radiotolerans]MDX5895464.1 hypothetical protein [Rubrobacter radiotolerans]SMC01525.1 conserved hypothetical protein [Rubrobacter radiotolerans DSM 5868]